MSLVTVDKAGDPTLAQLMRMKLEAAGIPVHLHSGEVASLFGGASIFGTIRVQVPENFQTQARALLKELHEDLKNGE